MGAEQRHAGVGVSATQFDTGFSTNAALERRVRDLEGELIRLQSRVDQAMDHTGAVSAIKTLSVIDTKAQDGSQRGTASIRGPLTITGPILTASAAGQHEGVYSYTLTRSEEHTSELQSR